MISDLVFFEQNHGRKYRLRYPFNEELRLFESRKNEQQESTILSMGFFEALVIERASKRYFIKRVFYFAHGIALEGNLDSDEFLSRIVKLRGGGGVVVSIDPLDVSSIKSFS